MRENLKIYGALVGSSILFPSSVLLLAASSIALSFKREEGIQVITILTSLTSLITFMCPVLTGINFVKPDSEINKPSSILILGGGLIALFSVIYYGFEVDFSLVINLNLIASILLSISGYLQFQDV